MTMASENNTLESYDGRLKGLDIDRVIDDARTKLAQWYGHCRQTIEEFYAQKLQELTAYTDETKRQYEEKKTTLQNYLSQLKEQQTTNASDPTQTDQTIRAIQRGLDDLEQMCIEVHLQPFVLDDSYICIGKKFDLRTLSTCTSTVPYSESSSSAIASNEQFLLMHQEPYLCLMDRNLQLVRQSPWNHGWIRDMCWSSTLRWFFVVISNGVFVVDEELASVTPLQGRFEQTWFSCTCSKKSLYLSTCEWGSSIYEYSLANSLNLVNQWKSPATCQPSEGINDIKYNDEKLALVIKDSQNHCRRITLKSASTFVTVWTLPLGTSSNMRLLTCCPLKYNEWLFIDGANSHIYHITRGRIKDKIDTPSVPYRANLFGSGLLVLATELTLNFFSVPH